MIDRASRLPLRAWLALALVAVVAAPTLAGWGIYTGLAGWQQQRLEVAQADIKAAKHVLEADRPRWDDPTWKSAARARLTALGVGVRLIDPGNKPLFSSSTNPTLVRPSGGTARDPLPDVIIAAKRSRARAQKGKEGAVPPDPVAALDIVKGPLGVGVLYVAQPQGPPWLGAAPLAGGLLALLLTLAGAGLLLGRFVVRPLAAMGLAARQIGAGDLEVRLPSSRAREVAEVAAALQAMGAALAAAGRRQAALEQERRLFIGAVAHDLRTPLFTLRAYLGGLGDGLAMTPEKAARYVAVCQDKADALERLVADLFAFAQVEYLEQEPHRAPLDMGALLRRSADGARPRAEAQGIALALDGPSSPCPFVGDDHLLTRAVENLLDNAIRHTPSGGYIRVRWRHEGGHLLFEVEDSGPGLAAADLPHLFTPLYHGEASRNRRTGGAGLGLAIARRILQAHGGDLGAANRPTGGAVFTGTLPIQLPTVERAAAPSMRRGAARDLHHLYDGCTAMSGGDDAGLGIGKGGNGG